MLEPNGYGIQWSRNCGPRGRDSALLGQNALSHLFTCVFILSFSVYCFITYLSYFYLFVCMCLIYLFDLFCFMYFCFYSVCLILILILMSEQSEH